MRTPISKEWECRKLFRAVFGIDAPASVIEWFSAVPENVLPKFSDAELRFYEYCLRHTSDLEALEYAGRTFGYLRPLTTKMQLIIYLGECEPKTRAQLLNLRDCPILQTCVSLAAHTLRSRYKLLKGTILLYYRLFLYRLTPRE